MNKTKEKKYFDSARTACGWILGYYGFVTVYNIVIGLVNRDEDTIIFGIVGGCIGAIFFWLVRRLRKEFNFKNISSIFLAFFGYAAFNLGSFAAEERWSVIAIKLAIYLPILVVLYRATKAVAYLNKVKE